LFVFHPYRSWKLQKELNCLPWQGKKAFGLWKRHVPVLLHLPQIFHIQWAKAAEEWIYLKTQFGVKFILSLRGAHINYSPLADLKLANTYREIFPLIDAFHAVSKAIACEARKYGADPEKINVIYSGLSPLKESFFNLTTSPINFSDSFQLLAIGRFHWKKGYCYLLEALHLLKLKQLPIELTLIAPGNLTEELLYQIAELNLQESIIHIKGLPFNELQLKMTEYDALILSSLEEGIANVVLEAMQIGLPVISTDCGGMSEVISHNINGFLVPIRNSKEIADIVEKLMFMIPIERNQIISEAKYSVFSKFNLERMKSDFIDMYRTL
jgi:colanic acid/amylovoran biosynthesis glycosyltransferase